MMPNAILKISNMISSEFKVRNEYAIEIEHYLYSAIIA